MSATPDEKCQERAAALMRAIDQRVGRSAIEGSRFMRDRYVAVLGELIGEIEVAMDSAKEIDFGPA